MTATPVLEMRHIAKAFGKFYALKGVDLTVWPGEIHALMGENGAGKSTLMKILAGAYTATSGEILIDGKPTSRLSGSALRQLRSRVGFVFQQFNLYAHLTAQENITLALERVHGWEKSAAQARALALLRQVGLEEKAQQMPAQLSGGQQQRVAIARALASSPQIILFDEPTSALDLYYQQHLLRLLKRLTAGGQLHVCVVLHDLNLAALWADRILLLHQGHLVAQGTPQEVIQQPVIHRWYGADVRLGQHPDNAAPQVYLAP